MTRFQFAVCVAVAAGVGIGIFISPHIVPLLPPPPPVGDFGPALATLVGMLVGYIFCRIYHGGPPDTF